MQAAEDAAAELLAEEAAAMVAKDPSILNALDPVLGTTGLMTAAERGNPDVVAALLSSHADPDVTTSNGSTALHVAADPAISTDKQKVIQVHRS